MLVPWVRTTKATGVLPAVKTIHRCSMHSAQKSLENACNGEVEVKRVLDALVCGPAGKGKDGDPGGLGRAVANSRKLQAHLKTKKKDRVESVVELLNTDFALHFAKQRFDSMADCTRRLVLDIDVVRDVLLEVAATDAKLSSWARKLLSAASLQFAASDSRHFQSDHSVVSFRP